MTRFSCQCALRWSDMDAFGHVNNVRYLTLYEEARVALLFDAARNARAEGMSDGLVVVRHEIDYLRPIDHGAAAADDGSSRHVTIELWTEEIRASRFTVAYELFDLGRLASRARTVLAPYDLRAGRPRRLTDPERSFLAAWRDENDSAVAGLAAAAGQAAPVDRAAGG